MPTKKQLPQMEDESVTLERTLHNKGEEARSYCFQLALCVQLALCPHLHEETDTRTFACAMEAAKRPYKKISSCAVDTDKKVRSAIKLCSYKFSYNVSYEI